MSEQLDSQSQPEAPLPSAFPLLYLPFTLDVVTTDFLGVR
jgi:hypothetical protein